MKGLVTLQAAASLGRIAGLLAAHDPAAARWFVLGVWRIAQEFGDIPLAFPLVLGLERQGVRRRPFAGFLVLYQVEGPTIIVLDVLQGQPGDDALAGSPPPVSPP